MEAQGVAPDAAFVEELVIAILGTRRLKMETVIYAREAIEAVLNAPVRHREEARRAIDQARRQDVKLSSLVNEFDLALRKVEQQDIDWK